MNDLTSGAASTAIPIPPPGTNFIDALRPALAFLLIGQTLGAVLIPMTIAVFYFSTRALRRSAMFWANVVVLVLGIVQSALNVVFEVHSILTPTVPLSDTAYIVNSIVIILLPIMIESILFLRILAVYPFNITPRAKFVAIITFPVVMKIARFINFSIATTGISHTLMQHNALTKQDPVTTGLHFLHSHPNFEIEWFLLILDNLYTSAAFLVKLNYRPFFGHSDDFRSASLTKKFRGIFWIATSNFVIPVFFTLTQAILYLVSKNNSILTLQIQVTSSYVSIYSVVFATIWVSGNSWYKENIPNGTDVLSTFRARRFTMGISGQYTVSTPQVAGPGTRSR